MATVAERTISVVLVGNPNTGKTTLFNALTGLRHRVGNYPGVTIETKTGHAKTPTGALAITDVPGTYSLSARSIDEMLAVELLLGHLPEQPRPQVVVCILDASNLERNLYLATQVLELGVPTVLALNMIDVADNIGIQIDPKMLEYALKVPVIPIQANAKRGLKELTQRIVAAAHGKPPALAPVFPAEFRAKVDQLDSWFQERGEPVERFLIERALLDAGGQTERVLVDRFGAELTDLLIESRQQLVQNGCPIPAIEARVRYAWIADRIQDAVVRPAHRKTTLTDRIDRILVHRVWGLLLFLLMMALMFQAIFSWYEPLKDIIDMGVKALGDWVGGTLPSGAIRDLMVSGVIAGVGGVLTFLPQIVILFGFIAILEDCGYMARAAFLMDKLMARCGLSGKSFIPMLSSVACAVPGIMATRTIEDRRDRFATIMVAPLMSCSARLPVYMVLVSAFFPDSPIFGVFGVRGLVVFCMYLIGMIVAPVVAWVLKRSLLRGETPVFLMELPSYKMPSLGMVLHRMFERGWAFVQRAGTLILATAVVVWALQYYPRPASVEESFAAEQAAVAALDESSADAQQELDNKIAAAYQEQSILGRMGKAIEPAVKPLGWDWKIGMAALASFPAREVFNSSLATIYSVQTDDKKQQEVRLSAAMQSARWPDGRPVFTPVVAISLMVFFALCCQCAATLAVIQRETRSWRWPIFTFVYMTTLAYLAALAVYQIGSRL